MKSDSDRSKGKRGSVLTFISRIVPTTSKPPTISVVTDAVPSETVNQSRSLVSINDVQQPPHGHFDPSNSMQNTNPILRVVDDSQYSVGTIQNNTQMIQNRQANQNVNIECQNNFSLNNITGLHIGNKYIKVASRRNESDTSDSNIENDEIYSKPIPNTSYKKTKTIKSAFHFSFLLF